MKLTQGAHTSWCRVIGKRKLRTLLCCGVLQFGALFGVPMRPEQVQELMRSLNEQKVARTQPEEAHKGGPPLTPR